MNELKIEYLPVNSLKPYERNARKHTDADVQNIVASIDEFGFDDPIGIWGEDNLIVEGHGRLLAAKKLGMETVPCIRLDHLTDEQRRAYALAHNKTAEMSAWDFDILPEELDNIVDIDMEQFGFDFEGEFGLPNNESGWFQRENIDGKNRQDDNDEYNEFVEKFEPKKTTDDCYTPEIVYDAIADFVANEFHLNRKNFRRPFFPGGDYQKEEYKKSDIVVDNPPFSILAEIIKYYAERDIKFFLFAPSLTLFSSSSSSSCCSFPCGGQITYENGAVVPTSFVSNLCDDRVRVVPSLYKVITEADAENQKQFKKTLPKYKYPDEVLTAAMCRYMCEHDTPFVLKKEDSCHIRQLDSQKEFDGSAIFGSGFLLSEKAAAEKAAAEKAAAEKAAAEKAAAEKAAAEKAAAEKAAAKVWELSEREKEIVRQLSGGD